MAGNKTARVFHAEPALSQRFGKIAELRHNRKSCTDEHERQRRRDPEPCRGRQASERGACRATSESRPGFARAPAGCEPRATGRPADHVSTDIGRPHDGKDPEQGRTAVRAASREPQQANAREGYPERTEGSPFRMEIRSPSSRPEDDASTEKGQSNG